MCRFLLYLGPEVLVSSVVIDPDHGMLQQASKAHDLITPLNADGFGVAWYVPSISPIPACFRDVSPAWSNQNLKQITRVSKSHCIFAHVRAASLGNVMHTNCHPFCYRNITFMHNGTIPYYKFIKRKMLQTVSDNAFNLIQGTTDSEMMFAMFVTIFERITGDNKGPDVPFTEGKDYAEDMAAAMRETLHQVHKFALTYENSLETSPDTQVQANGHTEEEDGPDGADELPELAYTKVIGRLNLAVTDGSSIVSARYVTSDPSTAHSLYYTRGARIEYQGKKCCVAKCPNSQPMVVVSSEPLGTSYECEVVPVNHMVVASRNNYFHIASCK